METANQQWIAARSAFHTAFTTLDEAYQKSLMSLTTKSVAENEKIVNIEQRFGEATLQQDLQAMSLTTRQKSIKKEEIREKCWL